MVPFRSVLLKEIASGHRVFVGFDFAYGYPVDFAAALQAPRGSHLVAHSRPPWASIIERQIERPMPMPSGFVV